MIAELSYSLRQPRRQTRWCQTGMLEKPGVFMADVFEFPDFLFGVLQSVPPNPKSRL
jgi:hypothetical protein